eukprot:s1441_g4.t1
MEHVEASKSSAPAANGQTGLPRFKLKDVLLLFFGIRSRHITEQLYQEAMGTATDGQGLMPLREVLLWARRQREVEFKDFRHKFQLLDCDGSGRVEFDKLVQLVGSLGLTVSEATVKELVGDSEDAYFGLGRKDGALDFDEFVNFMLKLKTREGFSIAEVKQFKHVFDRFDDNNNGEVEVLELADVLRYLGRTVKLDELQVLISQVDFNGSGALEFEEFLRLMRIHREEEVNKIRQAYCQFASGETQLLPKAKLPDAMAAMGVSGGYVHPALEPSLVSHGGISMMGVISSSQTLPEGTVVIELPRLALLDVDLLGSMPEDWLDTAFNCSVPLGAALLQYTAIASSTPNCTLSKGFTRSQRNLKLLVMLAIEKLKGATQLQTMKLHLFVCKDFGLAFLDLSGSTSEFSPYLELLPSQAELRGSDLYYAGSSPSRSYL